MNKYYWESELYKMFMDNCEGKSFDDIREWIIDIIPRYEQLLYYGEQNFYLNNMLESSHLEIENLKRKIEKG